MTVDLVTNSAIDGFGNTDTLSGIEGARGTNFADTLIGDDQDNGFTGIAGADYIDGGAGSDEVRYDVDAARGGALAVVVDLAAGTAMDGFGNMDTLVSIERVRGTAFDDVITGNSDSNSFRGLAGDDTMDGAGGSDWVSYSRDIFMLGEGESLAGGVFVNLGAGTATDSFGDTDTLVSIENVGGGTLADHFIGTAGENVFRGFGGNDLIDGAGGDDSVDYSQDASFGATLGVNGSNGVIVNLASGTATDGFGDSDTLISIEGVIGTSFADAITGDGNANRLEGGAGDDLLTGGLGADVFVLGVGWEQDTVTDFEDGTDIIDMTAVTVVADIADLTITQAGLDVLISATIDPANTITLQNMTVAQIGAGDFLFEVN